MNTWILFYIWENWGSEAQIRDMNFPRLLSQEVVRLAPIPWSFTVSTGVSWKKTNFQWQEVGTTWGKCTFGTILFFYLVCAHPMGISSLHSLSTCRRLDCRSGWRRPRARLSLRFRFKVRTFSRTCGQSKGRRQGYPKDGSSGLYSPHLWSRLLSL